ncbi:23S rRNA (adenine(2030)-N(6))-methyltransferase RlmJ [Sedimenticola selenatireducens]|uniref:Ribosomal RNA large subunit methyltransferase J n=1 Tax=Sedimenticola selenatireducens TaxID=191960 RepID=A0A558DTT4_9GAMM|nr:23S rRNA (adenine(2030)-N(6))-methyltransferase RlmJ [Sedimenticola selenatireducens]TVO77009.1 23S rRNA (adenine(2030)-N(6))-methyltransferase RlmJ [Sedimenticola selenatireducens]TVT64452.1 MAG: 23S rRNA (adenine(2030)-N(6))-methyltransferase RlmJ [Sedimenticola selenatireducens]
MLSYRHAFHAGNFADVLKHLVLAKTIEYMTQKPTPILYIDTHAGTGRYPLNNAMSLKTGEYALGAGAIKADLLDPAFSPYGEVLNRHLAKGIYPGSPQIAADLLSPLDQIRLFELHSTDFPLLEKWASADRRIKAVQSDGHQALRSLLPAVKGRALVLMDPSFEVKQEYQQVISSLEEGYKRMPNATYLLWYPVVQRAQIDKMIQQIQRRPFRDVWQFELCLSPDTADRGMTGSGILAINPPWTLPKELEALLPRLQQRLSPKGGHYRITNLIPE